MIRFYCPCGKRLKVRAKDAGRLAKCSQCGAKLRVPEPADPADPREALASAVNGGGGLVPAPALGEDLPTAEIVEPPPPKGPGFEPESPPLEEMAREAAPPDGAANALEAMAGAPPPTPRRQSPSDVPSQPGPNPGAAAGLAALAQAVSSAPADNGDPLKKVRQRVNAAAGPGSGRILMGGSGNGGSSKKGPLVIGIAAGVVAVGVIVGVIIYAATRDDGPPGPAPEPTRSTRGSTAGELFPGVPGD